MQTTILSPQELALILSNREAQRPGPRPQGAYRPSFSAPQPPQPAMRPSAATLAAFRPR